MKPTSLADNWRELIPGRLFVGGQSACSQPRPQLGDRVGVIVHACKYPCYHDKVGQLTPADKRYLGFEEAGDLYLNLIDPKTPMFHRQSFEKFLRFARDNWLVEQPLLIHCNQGNSRAPTLALVFMAKVLQSIPDTSYDEAWDAFAEEYGPYAPSEGIETWLRSNWNSIPSKPVNFSGGTSKRKFWRYQLPDVTKITAEETMALMMGSPIVHFASMVQIEDKRHELIIPVPNVLQMRIAEAYEWCMAKGVQPRLIILKPRQSGSSTVCVHLIYHHARRFHVDGMMMGDEFSRTMKIWQMFCDYAARDRFPWDSTFKFDTKKASITYADGSIGQWEQETSSDPKAGIAGTRQVILYTEPGRYAKSGTRTDTKVITASMFSLAKVPHSLAIMESTPDGASGYYHNTWQQGATIEEAKAGIHGNGWLKIFAAWFEFSEHTLPRLPQYEQYFHKDFSTREKRGIALYGWDASQIAWRRYMISCECDGDESTFDADFAENDLECFLQSGRPRFDDEGVTRLEIMAAAEHNLADRGVITGDGLRVIFTPVTDDPWLWLKEKPIPGCSYIVFGDFCAGGQSVGAKNPDAHAVGVLRQAYMDEGGRFFPVELVAAIDVPNGCRWDASLIAERTVLLANLYGGVMIVPEANGPGMAAINKMRELGANIYQRQKPDATMPGKTLPVLGWDTNSMTRDILVSALADAIRGQEQGFNCCYKPAVKEFRTFIVDDREKACAAPGAHDDWCLGAGIGLACLKFAGTYMPFTPTVQTKWSGAKKESAFSF